MEHIGAVGGPKKWFVNLNINLPGKAAKSRKCQLDSGSTCNTFSYKDFKSLTVVSDGHLSGSLKKLKT